MRSRLFGSEVKIYHPDFDSIIPPYIATREYILDVYDRMLPDILSEKLQENNIFSEVRTSNKNIKLILDIIYHNLLILYSSFCLLGSIKVFLPCSAFYSYSFK